MLILLYMPIAGWAQNASKNEEQQNRWYVGGDAGVSFGGATFKSFGADKTRAGFGLGVLGGYHLNSFLSAEGELRYTRLGLGSRECDRHLWLGADGGHYYAPVAGMNSWQYKALYSSSNLFGLAARLNINILYFFRSESRWSVLLSPELSGMGAWAKVKTVTNKTKVYDESGFHFGMGGELGVGYQLCEQMNLRLYSGMTYLTGKGIDGVPQTDHKSNYTWNTGVKVTFALNKRKRSPAPETPPVMPVVPPVQPQPKPQPKPKPVPEPVIPAPQPVVKETTVYEVSIYFSTGKSEYIEPSQYDKTNELLQALVKYPDCRVEITGWADKRGSEGRNAEISQLRAETIKRYLMRKRIAADRITTQSKGIDKASSSSEARRAEVRLIVTEK